MSSLIAAQKDSEVKVIFDVVGSDGTTLQTGVTSGQMTISLHNETTGAATEAVTIAEIGSGYYTAAFTPLLGGNPPTIYLLDILLPYANGFSGAQHRWQVQVYDALPAYGGATTDLTTLANVKQHIGIPTADTGDDALLTNLISRVSEFIKAYTKRSLTQTTKTEVHDGKGRDKIWLRDWPVISMTSVHEDPDQTFDSTTLIDSGDYLVDSRKGVVVMKSGSVFLRYPQSVQAIYVAGYATIPADLEMAAIEIISAKYKARGKEGLSSEAAGDVSQSFIAAEKGSAWLRNILGLHMRAR